VQRVRQFVGALAPEPRDQPRWPDRPAAAKHRPDRGGTGRDRPDAPPVDERLPPRWREAQQRLQDDQPNGVTQMRRMRPQVARGLSITARAEGAVDRHPAGRRRPLVEGADLNCCAQNQRSQQARVAENRLLQEAAGLEAANGAKRLRLPSRQLAGGAREIVEPPAFGPARRNDSRPRQIERERLSVFAEGALITDGSRTAQVGA